MKFKKDISIIVTYQFYDFIKYVGDFKEKVYINSLSDKEISIKNTLAEIYKKDNSVKLLNFFYIFQFFDNKSLETIFEKFNSITKEIFEYSVNYEFFYRCYLIVVIPSQIREKLDKNIFEEFLTKDLNKIFTAIFIFSEDSYIFPEKFYQNINIFLEVFISNSKLKENLNYFFSKYSFLENILPVYSVGLTSFKIFDKSIHDLLLSYCFNILRNLLFKNNINIIPEKIEKLKDVSINLCENLKEIILNKELNLIDNFLNKLFYTIKEIYINSLKHNVNLNEIVEINKKFEEIFLNDLRKLQESILQELKTKRKKSILKLIFSLFKKTKDSTSNNTEEFYEKIVINSIKDIISEIKSYLFKIKGEIEVLKSLSLLETNEELPEILNDFFIMNNIKIEQIMEEFVREYIDEITNYLNNEDIYFPFSDIISKKFTSLLNQKIEKEILNLEFNLDDMNIQVPDLLEETKLLISLNNLDNYIPKLFFNTENNNIKFFTPYNYIDFFKKGILKDFYEDRIIIKIIGPINLNDIKSFK